jgi:hypothetical protein
MKKLSLYSSAVAAVLFVSLISAPAQSPLSAPNTVVTKSMILDSWSTERETLTFVTNLQTGEVSTRVGKYTELANGLNYRDAAGNWQPAREEFVRVPGGFLAPYGVHTVFLADNLNREGSVDHTATDARFRIAPLALAYFDPVTGQQLTLAHLQDCFAQQVSSNVIAYPNAFREISATVRYVYRKGEFHQDVLLHESPPNPRDLGLSERSRLQMITVFSADTPNPREVTRRIRQEEDPLVRQAMVEPDFEDDILFFGEATIMSEGKAFSLGLDAETEATLPVGKRLDWINGRPVLFEEVEFSALEPLLRQLPKAAAIAPLDAPGFGDIAGLGTRDLPARRAGSLVDEGIQLASRAVPTKAVVLDYVTLTSTATSFSATAGTTYYISSSYGVGPGSATFVANTFFKFAVNAYFYMYGTISFPSSGAAPIFTSKDDNLYGEPTGTGNPTFSAGQAVWVYYVTANVTIQNAHFRWAKRAVQLDADPGVSVTHTISNCKFEQSDIGIFVNLPSGSATLSSSTNCGVVTPTYTYSGTRSGSLSPNCGDTQFAWSNLQHETAVTIDPSNPSRVAMFASHFQDGQNPTVGILQVTSADGGKTWPSKRLIATGSDNLPQGRNDQQAAFDQFGNLFLVYNDYNNPNQIRIGLSTDAGATWNLLTTFSGTTLDRPVVATGPADDISGNGSVWVLYVNGDHLTLAGALVTGLGTVGTWSSYTPGCSTAPTGGIPPVGTGLAVGPAGKVVMGYETRTESGPGDRKIFINVDTDGLGSSQPTSGCTFSVQVNMKWLHEIPAQSSRKIGRVPVLAWDRWASSSYWNRIYLAYTDTKTTSDIDKDTDIYVKYSDNDGASWTTKQVNTTSTQSQFFAGLAVDQTTSRVAVSWYDCRNDADNKATQFFAAVSTDGFSTAQPRNFQLNPTGSNVTTNTCVNADVNYGDYTGLAFHGGYFFPVWASYTDSNGSAICADIHTCKVAW